MPDHRANSAALLDVGLISDAFLRKYNRPGPRYTSYPTAPVWKEDFGPDDLEKYFARAEELKTPLSLYMHLPFCESLCLFCASHCGPLMKEAKLRLAGTTGSLSTAISWLRVSP